MVGCDTNLTSNGNGLVGAESAFRVAEEDVLAHVRAGSFEGIFALSKAAPPKGVSAEGLGSFAWWNDFSSGQMYLYSRLINSPADANDALVNLERDLGVDSSDMIAELSLVGLESNAANRAEDPAGWEPATFTLALEIMGVDPADYVDSEKALPPVAVDCIELKSVSAIDESVKSLSEPLKGILLASQASCGNGGGPPTHCPGDIDCDGIPNASDPDMDGDGILNISDSDVDGDGDPNSSDPDIDGDGTPNGSDSDVDGDTLGNGNSTTMGGDSDIDGDGIDNANDPDADGDGILNINDSDADGDGSPNDMDDSPNGCTADCSGACCNKSTGFCSVTAKSSCTQTLDFFAGTDKICNPNPCCIQKGNPTFAPTDARIMRKPIPIPPNNPNWGETGPEEINITTSFACDGTQWCAVVDGIEGIFTEWYRLLPGVTEVTGPSPGNTTEINHCLQVFDLNAPNADSWFMLEAVHAHEEVHASRLLPALQATTPFIEGLYEGFCVPHTLGMTESDAKNAIKGLLGWSNLNGLAFNQWSDKFVVLTANDDAQHGQTKQAEHLVLDPMIDSICTLNLQQCWAICLACPARLSTPNGACCAPGTGVCNIKTECKCIDGGGTYRGDDTTCDPTNPCKGACCAPSNSCTESTQSRCTSVIGGIYQGDGTTCATTGCGPTG